MAISKLGFLRDVCYITMMWCAERNLFVIGVLAHYPASWDDEIIETLLAKGEDIRVGIGIKGGFHGVYVVNDGAKEDAVVLSVDSCLPNYSEYAAMPRLYKIFT
jgi:inorganic pyrophosphatase